VTRKNEKKNALTTKVHAIGIRCRGSHRLRIGMMADALSAYCFMAKDVMDQQTNNWKKYFTELVNHYKIDCLMLASARRCLAAIRAHLPVYVVLDNHFAVFNK